MHDDVEVVVEVVACNERSLIVAKESYPLQKSNKIVKQ